MITRIKVASLGLEPPSLRHLEGEMRCAKSYTETLSFWWVLTGFDTFIDSNQGNLENCGCHKPLTSMRDVNLSHTSKSHRTHH